MPDDIGIIVGSGFERLDWQATGQESSQTPYGASSAPVVWLNVGRRKLACLARHGASHAIAPHLVNYRANVWILHSLGIRRCIAINAVGGIAAGFKPGDLAVPDQLIDYTWGRDATFSEEGRVVHIDFTEPFDPVLRGQIADAVAECGLRPRSGTYGVTQGPRLETAAEVDRLERDGCAMVGMTAMPEAALARELGLEYAILAFSVNDAAGRGESGSGIHAQIERALADGMRRVERVIETLIPAL